MNTRPTLLRIGLAVAVLAVTIGAAFVVIQYKNNPSVSNSNKLQVIASANFWGNIVSQIGGDHVEVTSIISDPNTDPHLYESDAHDAAALSSVDIVIKNGLGYDDFIDKLLAASPSDNRQILSVEEILKSSGDTVNPHLWYDIPRIPEVADAIGQALAAKDPDNTADYISRLAMFKKGLQPLLDTVQKIKANYSEAPVAYTERVPEYLLHAAGLVVKTPPGFASSIEEGNEPSPGDTAKMEALITSHSIRALLYNAQATSSVTQRIRDLAEQAHIPVVPVTETLPSNEPTYQSWQLNQTKALLRALEQ